MATEGPVLLDVKGLSVAYGKAVAVRDVTFSIRAGEFVAMLGRNGAGKSTILHAVSGLVGKMAGQVRIDGVDVTNASPKAIVRRGIVQVLEGHRVFTGLSVEDNLLLGLYAQAGNAADRRHNLGRVYALFPELAERRHQHASRLSGGQQQILAVGQGVIGSPRLLILDEPSGGLAPLLIDRVLEAASALCRSGTAILLVEQLVSKALERAHSALVIETGEIVSRGPARQIAQSPALLEGYLGATTVGKGES